MPKNALPHKSDGRGELKMMSTRADFPVLTYVHSHQGWASLLQSTEYLRSTSLVLYAGFTSYMGLGDLEYCLNGVSKSGDSTTSHLLCMEYIGPDHLSPTL